MNAKIKPATPLAHLTMRELIDRKLRLERMSNSSDDTDEYCRLLARLTDTCAEIERRKV